ncbi:MAG: hypothetical protein QOE97_926 [Pseudonocardiales bacterium]|nr:hypothetical protein [Pseudonocardiales bacterium]
MADLQARLTELADECADLDALVADVSPEDWARRTPAPGWTIATQIAHLAWTDDIAVLAATDPDGFQVELTKALHKIGTVADEAALERARQPADELLASWRAGRDALAKALRDVPDGTRLPWFGPPMAPATMASARLMETWAHGQDVADALAVTRTPAARLRSVAHIGVRTRDFAFALRDKPVPTDEFRVELIAPDGSIWAWGPEDATQLVTGPALDFCLLVTQRRNRADLALRTDGADADAWLGIAQAFAGPPGRGREPSAP